MIHGCMCRLAVPLYSNLAVKQKLSGRVEHFSMQLDDATPMSTSSTLGISRGQ